MMTLSTPQPWIEGTWLERPHRFMIRAQTADGIVEAHCPNSGSLKDVCKVGAPVLLLPVRADSERALRHTWHWVRDGEAWVGVHTHHPNMWVGQALQDGLITELGAPAVIQREVVVKDHGRLDFLLDHRTYVEVKSVHWRAHPTTTAIFPDGVTARGLKHLNALKDLVSQGFEAVVLFVVQRDDCDAVAPAWHIDPKFAQAWVDLKRHGVRCLAYACHPPYTGKVGLSRPVDVLERA